MRAPVRRPRTWALLLMGQGTVLALMDIAMSVGAYDAVPVLAIVFLLLPLYLFARQFKRAFAVFYTTLVGR